LEKLSKSILKNYEMIISILIIAAGLIAVIAIMVARAKHKDSNGPMTNN
jgi:hypothetical protein